MDQPSSSREIPVNDVDFVNRIDIMLRDSDIEDEIADESDTIDDSDADPDYIQIDEDRSDSEDSVSEDDEEILDREVGDHVLYVDRNLPKYVSGRLRKNELGPGYPWCTEDPHTNVRVRTPARNIVRGPLPGLKLPARRLGLNPSKLAIWNLLFEPSIVDKIVTHTNQKLAVTRNGLGETTNKRNYRDTDTIEINAFIGLLLLSSVLRSSHEPVISMFSKDPTNRPYFNAAMSAKRFEILSSALRFDESATRQERVATNKAAAISEIFDTVIANSQTLYSPSEHVTIDEMLVPFRGRCSFRVYMPNKPHKYGLKVMCLTDAKTSYLYNAYIYVGKNSDGIGLQPSEQNYSIPTQSVIRLCKPIEKTNRNVTADNWFSSMEVTDVLENVGLTYVGTLKKDKKEIPTEFLADKNRRVNSARFGFSKNRTLVSFVPKQNRAVVLVSSMHKGIEVSEEKNKPEIICFYNKTKCGVDILDMKCAVYTTNKRTRRWPMAIFYRLLSVASINCCILYLCYRDSPTITRFQFTKELGQALVEPHLRRRLMIANLRRDVRDSILKALGTTATERVVEGVPSDKMEKRKTCYKCPSAKERKTQYKCIQCNLPICLECSRKVCVNCAVDM